MIDLHTHIAFGLDDGCETEQEAVSVLNYAKQNGTDSVVFTPHFGKKSLFFGDSPKAYFKRITERVQNAALNSTGVKIYSGAEIFCDDDILNQIKSGGVITLNGSRYALIEFDFHEYPEEIKKFVSAFLQNGYIPVIAHAERYRAFFKEPQAVKELAKSGAVIQVNAESLTNNTFFDWCDTAHLLLKSGLVDVVASDAHGLYGRGPDLSLAHEQISLKTSLDYADLLLSENPANILQNKTVFKGEIK